MAEYQPLHVDRHRGSINLTLILSLAVMGMGLLAGNPLLFFVGAGFAIWAWFMTPGSYALFDDRLVIAYGRPRLRIILFEHIQNVELVTLALASPRLRVNTRQGRGAWLVPRDVEAFNDQFQEALERFNTDHPEGRLPPPEESSPPQKDQDFYEILQVDAKADVEVIEAAYRRLSLRYHPDHNKSPEAAAMMKLLNGAYEILSDPERRAAYDRERSRGNF